MDSFDQGWIHWWNLLTISYNWWPMLVLVCVWHGSNYTQHNLYTVTMLVDCVWLATNLTHTSTWILSVCEGIDQDGKKYSRPMWSFCLLKNKQSSIIDNAERLM